MRFIVLGMKSLSTVEDENFVKIIKGNIIYKICTYQQNFFN